MEELPPDEEEPDDPGTNVLRPLRNTRYRMKAPIPINTSAGVFTHNRPIASMIRGRTIQMINTMTMVDTTINAMESTRASHLSPIRPRSLLYEILMLNSRDSPLSLSSCGGISGWFSTRHEEVTHDVVSQRESQKREQDYLHAHDEEPPFVPPLRRKAAAAPTANPMNNGIHLTVVVPL